MRLECPMRSRMDRVTFAQDNRERPFRATRRITTDMLQALLAGMASIEAQQTRINVIGNNLANVNTTAFKSSDVRFEDMISQTLRGATAPNGTMGGTNPVQYGLGVMVAGTESNLQQGTLSATNNPSDLAIQGNGYFMVSNGTQTSYTRDGSFGLDANGNLVQNATGQLVLGWAADNGGKIDSTTPVTPSSKINIPVGQLSAVQPTSTVTMAGNLKGDAGASDTWTTTVQVFDNLGSAHNITLKFSGKKAVGTQGDFSWDWSASEGSTALGTGGTLTFDSSGKIKGGQTGTVPLSATPAQNITVDFSQVSALAAPSQVQASSQNGFPPGSLANFTIGNDGTVTGVFTNGLTKPIGQIAMATFPNPGGMEQLGSNEYRPTDNSGLAVVGTPNSNGRGSINSGFLEQSNVDIGTQFTNMIVTQRGFQANTKIVTTVDQMLQDLLAMKQ